MSIIPIMVISQGKPMFSAMEPPMEGPGNTRRREVGQSNVQAGTPQFINVVN